MNIGSEEKIVMLVGSEEENGDCGDHGSEKDGDNG